MKPEVLRHRDFWKMASTAAQQPGHAAHVLADWLDEHDSPIRAHIMRHGAPQHNASDRGPGITPTWSEQEHDGVILPDEGKQVRVLHGNWASYRQADHPLASHHEGPESYELFRASALHPGPPDRYVVRYTLRLPQRTHLRLIAAVTPEQVQAIAEHIDHVNNASEQMAQVPFNYFHQQAQILKHPTVQHEDRATPLARLRVGPGAPNGQAFGSGGPLHTHPIHDESGAQVGSVRVQPRNDGKHLHIDWVEGDLGAGARSVLSGLAEHYPQAEFVSGIRGGNSGFRGASEAERVVVPIRRTKLARPEGHSNFIRAIRDNPDEPTARLTFADFLEDHGVPGAHIVRQHAQAMHAGDSVRDGALGALGPLLLLGPTPKVALTHDANGNRLTKGAKGTYTRLRKADFRERPVVQPSWGGGIVRVAVAHKGNEQSSGLTSDNAESVIHFASAESPEQLEHLISDFPEWAKKYMRGAPLQHLHATADPTKLARTEDMAAHETGAQVNADDATGWLTLADHYDENEEPGSTFLREHAKHLQDNHMMLGSHAGPRRAGRDRMLSNQATPGLYRQHLVESQDHEVYVRHPAIPETFDDFIPRVVAVKRLGANRFPIHVSATPENVEGLAKDMGPHEGEVLRRQVRLAYPEHQTKLARMQAPTGGAIVNQQYQKGGQFLARAFKSIRATAERLAKLSREPKASVAVAVGQQPTGENRLTLGDLKRVEDDHQIPPKERLSPHAEQTEGAVGDEHPYTANVERIARFVDSLVRRRIPSSQMKAVLRDDKKSSDHKFMHLLVHLMAEHEASPRISWYGEHMNTLDRLLHKRFATGPSDPLWGTLDEKGELVGKHDPATHHPATVLFKALVAATSASQTPVDNLSSAVRAWKAGAAGGDPILHAPHFNVEELKKWTDQMPPEALASVGSDPVAKAKWYAQNIHGKFDFGEGKTPYSSFTARVLMMDDPTDHRHGTLISHDQNGKNVKNPAAPKSTPAGGRVHVVDLPLTDASGIRAKGWARYGKQVAAQMLKVQALVRVFSGPDRTQQQAYSDAARWLLTPHSPQDFDAMMKRAKLHGSVNAEKVYKQGFLDKNEAIPGSFILGPKFGPFFLNLHANDPQTRESKGAYLTADKWWTRTFHRYLAKLVTAKNKIHESPSPKTRKLMRNVVALAAKAAGVSPAELQADMWYYEQSLYRMLGAKSADSYSYADAANKFLHPDSPHRLSRPGGLTKDVITEKGVVVRLHPVKQDGKWVWHLLRVVDRNPGNRRKGMYEKYRVESHGLTPQEVWAHTNGAEGEAPVLPESDLAEMMAALGPESHYAA